MNRLIFSFLFLISFQSFAQNFCDTEGNIIVFSNFEGGVMDIVVDKEIPNLKIGVNAYYNVDVRISGPYASTVTGIYITTSGRKGMCASIPKSLVSGAPTSAVVTISDLSYFAPCGGFEGGSSCNDGFLDPTYAELIEFFETSAFKDNKLMAYREQFACWTNKRLLISEGGNCCPKDLKVIVADAGTDKVVCLGDGVAIGARNFKCSYLKLTWSPSTGLEKTNEGIVYAKPTKTTTYTLTLDNNGVVTRNEMVVYVKEIPKVPILSSNSPVCAGDDLQLSVSPNTGETYAWEGPNNYYGFGNTIVSKNASKLVAGTYSVYADLNGCGTTIASIKVVIKECGGKNTNGYSNANKPTQDKTEQIIVSAPTKPVAKPVVEKPVATKPVPNTPANSNTNTKVVEHKVEDSTPTKTAEAEKPKEEPKTTETKPVEPITPESKSGSKSTKYKFENSRKNGVFVVSGFDMPVEKYDRFVVLNDKSEEIFCRRQKFGSDKLIVDISDKPFGNYILLIRKTNGSEEKVEFTLGVE